ncbi:L-aspartate oxidase [Exiguobacterium qingdaonense]|uniref:L-aspartate oxidase n=1 Tax=Exiguobacterium qingdaonense TaxID=2751251 RepID=UPI001BEAF0A5|nr:FAD-binding protein [Exiguobacterium qingdaonense]
MSLHKEKADILIIGTGLAAVTTALHIPSDLSVILVSKSELTETNSDLAQGGIASSYLEETSEAHKADTMFASNMTSCIERVDILTAEGRQTIEEMERFGVRFDRDGDGYDLGREGAHQTHRIFHAGGDETGRHVMRQLRRSLPDNVKVLEHVLVHDLVVWQGRVVGAMAFQREERIHIEAGAVVLATGGIGGLVDWTSNVRTVTGDGLVLANRCGAELTHLQRIQFHPTLLATEEPRLVTEALRGAGATLIDADGRHVMAHHLLGSLAPRDEVARVLTERNGPIYLDTTNVTRLHDRFPKLALTCDELGIDLRQIPVRPGLHFHMGGIEVDDMGRTGVDGLYAVGEVADTGVHGANRLASNSLLECWVFGKRVAQAIQLNDAPFTTSESLAYDISFEMFQELRSQIGNWLTISPNLEEMKCFLQNTQSLTLTKHVTRQLSEQTLLLDAARLLAQSILGMERHDEHDLSTRTTTTVFE